MKKIIKIGGTAFSGSTFLDLILANDPKGFSCGEMYALFRPHRQHHFNPTCSCRDKNCDIWGTLKRGGESKVFKNLSLMFPKVSFFVDSSKDTEFFADQIDSGVFDGFVLVNVIIWKTPAEFAYSCYKRGKLDNWRRSYINYHKQYFSLVDECYSLKYSDFVSDTDKTLKELCEKVGINFFQEKQKFWFKEHHTLFGSDSAKLHLYEPWEPKYKEIAESRVAKKPNVETSKEPEVKHHREIYKPSICDIEDSLPADVKDEINNDNELRLIQNILESCNISSMGDHYLISKDKLALLKPKLGWKILKKIKRNFLQLFVQIGK